MQLMTLIVHITPNVDPTGSNEAVDERYVYEATTLYGQVLPSA